jgi:ferredoxin, 2Fe-2S
MSRLTVLPANASAEIEPGQMLIHAAHQAGVELEAGCFNCFCGTCVVEVLLGMENLEAPSDEELEVLDQWNKDSDHFRLSCCAKVKGPGDLVIRAGH